jgi:hypothetical protein
MRRGAALLRILRRFRNDGAGTPGMLLSAMKFNFKSPRAGPAGIISERQFRWV